MAYFIYALADPHTDEVVYVGITDNIRKRFREHVACKDTNAAKNAWIRLLLKETLTPSLKILETVGSFLYWMSLHRACHYYNPIKRHTQSGSANIIDASRHTLL